VQVLQTIDRSTFITVVDLDRTLYEVRPLQSRHRPASAHARERPALLLGGDAEVTRFVDRDAELASLTEWYDSADRVSAMLVHGAAGQGKTRLMRQFAGTVRRRDGQPQLCEALSLTEVSVQGMAGEDEAAGRDGAAPSEILLIVDEADAWPTRKLLKLFRDAATWRSERVRVLLAARAAGQWWSGLYAELGPLEIARCELRVEPLDAAGMRELARAAGRSLARAQGWARPPPLPQEVLDQLAGSPPLSVELMVLARLHASGSGQQVPGNLRAAVEVILEKELRYWARMYGMERSGEDLYRICLQSQFMARAVYVATLTGPLPSGIALQVVRHARIGCDADPRQVIDDHARCYPPPDDDCFLAPLAPCLAEEFLGMLVPDPRHERAFLARDAWATDAPFHVLGLMTPQERDSEALNRRRSAAAGIEPPPPTPLYSPDYTFGPQLDPVILRLVRAAATRPHLADRQLYPLALHYPKAVVMAANTALAELTEIRPQPPDNVLQALEEAVSECDRQDLSDYHAAVDALQRLADREGPPEAPLHP
jgi:hypothetical protein